MRKHFLFLILFALLAGVLVACNRQDNVAIARAYIEAINDRDFDAARELVCDEREEEVLSALMDVEEEQSFSFDNVTCTATGEGVECRFQIVQPETDVGALSMQSATFDFEDGEVCNIERGAGANFPDS